MQGNVSPAQALLTDYNFRQQQSQTPSDCTQMDDNDYDGDDGGGAGLSGTL